MTRMDFFHQQPLDRGDPIAYKRPPETLFGCVCGGFAFINGSAVFLEVCAQVAQLVEHATENRSVGGSIPPLGTTSFP